MVELQILSKVLLSSDNSIIEDNFLTADYFLQYQDEYKFIQDHIKKYGNVPDKETFLSNFPDFELVEVSESDQYLVNTIQEEHLYYQSVPVIQKVAELMKTDSNSAMEYWQSKLSELQPTSAFGGTDIIHNAEDRLNQYRERKSNQDNWFFESGFKELDDIIHGIQREEELLVIVARTNQGKSWVLEKIAGHIWNLGFNVGYLSPEMSANSIGFRLDTLLNGVSNKGLMWGKGDVDESSYETYIDNLKSKTNKFMVANPKDFGGSITVSKLKTWVSKYKLDAIAIDGITYLTDERFRRGDNKTTSLTNISEDLMSMSVELKIPVMVVVQANRSGVAQDDNDGTPELESIRDSDGIAHNASKVLSIRQKKDNILEIGIKKQRFGAVGGKVQYTWDIDTGIFTYAPNEERQEVQRKPKKDKKEVDMF